MLNVTIFLSVTNFFLFSGQFLPDFFVNWAVIYGFCTSEDIMSDFVDIMGKVRLKD